MRLGIFIMCVIPLLVIHNVAAQEISLDSAVALAWKNNPVLAVALLQTEQQRELAKTSGVIPKTDVSMLYGQYNSWKSNDNNLTVTQRIPFPTVLGRERKLNEALATSSKLNENVVRNELRFQVETLFNYLLYLNAKRDVLLRQDSLVENLARVAGLQYETGESTLLAKTSAETQLMEVRNAIVRNGADLRIGLSKLQTLCQTGFTEVGGDLEGLLTIEALDSATGIHNNPAKTLTGQQVDIAERTRKLTVSQMLPEIQVGYFSQTLIGFQNVNGVERYFGASDRFDGFEVGLSIPLWYSPFRAKIRAASVARDIAIKRSEAFDVELSQQYNQAILEAERNQKSITYYKEFALENAALLKRQIKVAFRSGEVDYRTVLINLQQALDIEEGYLTALYEYNQNLATIRYLTGENL